ncbi:MAG: hypothetical protein GY805_29095 [Chloroflexi bacterium]|nr:hypothetical protein [Chloroflexota bacterium]
MEQEIVLTFAKQSIRNVSIPEWRQYPVWIETDNWHNEDEVAPWINSHLFRLRGGICYVHSQFILKNQTEYEGYIRISMGLVTAIFISLGEKGFIGHVLNKDTKQFLDHTEQRLAHLLELSVEEVFPISYRCLAAFADEPSLSGIIGE